MRTLNQNELLAVGGGDNDGNAGEAEAAAFYAKYGVCDRNADNTMYYCVGRDGAVSIGNVW
jgi:hypothetical protein